MASRKLDKIIVVDVESTCWDGDPPQGEKNEIIEIGVCLLDIATGERTQKESILVRPHLSSVSAFCTRLTTLTQEQVLQGISFKEACSLLNDRFHSRSRVWASFGDYDRSQFERQCKREDVMYPFNSSHINVKTLFAVVHKYSHEVGMSIALKHLGLPLEGIHHRGGDDAWNIAAILSRLLERMRQL
jgi:inhibitor of KinA sporulation pathway (predicted exonuclease)